MTARCQYGWFRFKPDRHRTQLVGYHLARVQKRFPSVLIHAVIQMSNHLHLVVTDLAGQLSQFMEQFESLLARDINRLDGTSGTFFEDRFSAIRILDDDALIDRIAYTATNPVAAGLVRDIDHWPGIAAWRPQDDRRSFRRLRRMDYLRARARNRGLVNPADFVECSTLRITPFSAPGRDTEKDIENAIRSRVADIVRQRGRRSFLGLKAVLRQRPFQAARKLRRSPEPLCHASSFDRWVDFVHQWRELVHAYRRASRAFRSGQFDVSFPPFTFRPWSYV